MLCAGTWVCANYVCLWCIGPPCHIFSGIALTHFIQINGNWKVCFHINAKKSYLVILCPTSQLSQSTALQIIMSKSLWESLQFFLSYFFNFSWLQLEFAFPLPLYSKCISKMQIYEFWCQDWRSRWFGWSSSVSKAESLRVTK